MTAVETLCMMQAFGGEDFQVESLVAAPRFMDKLSQEVGDQIRHVTCAGQDGYEIAIPGGIVQVWARRKRGHD